MSPAGATPAERNVFCRPEGSKDNCCLHRGNSCRHLNEVCEGKRKQRFGSWKGLRATSATTEPETMSTSFLLPACILVAFSVEEADEE